MSEEIKNEEVLSSEEVDATQAQEIEQVDSSEASASDVALSADEAGESVEADVVEAVDEEQISVEAEESVVEQTAEEAVESAEEAVESAEEAVESAEEAEESMARLAWQERLERHLVKATLTSYVKALRLVDFHRPGDFQLAETWGLILNAKPEMAREIFATASRYVTSEPGLWAGILEAHSVAMGQASDEGQIAISETMALIQCLRSGELEAGLASLANFESAHNTAVAEELAIVATGNWRKLEQAVEARLAADGLVDDAQAVEMAHIVADYALGTGSLDRAVEMMRRTSRKIEDDSLKWRLAILSRDQQKWNAYVDVLSKELINLVVLIEEKVEIYEEMIRIYRDETKQDAMVVKTYESLIAEDPENDEAIENLVEIYEKMRRWPDLIKVLETQAEASKGDRKVAFYERIALIYLEKLSRKVDAIKYFEFVLEAEPSHEATLEQLKVLYNERRDWEKLIGVHSKELVRIADLADQITLLVEMADIAKTKLRNNGVSIDIWVQVLDRDGKNAEAIEALEALYEGEKRWADLAAILERKIALSDDEQEKFQLLQKLGPLYSDRVGDNVGAIGVWRRVLAIDPSFAKGVDSLRKLLIEERDWASLEAYYADNDILQDLVRLFEQLSKTLKDDADKKAVLLRAAYVYEGALSDSDKALATLEKILDIDAKDAAAAGELVRYYEARSNYEALARMLEILHAASELGEVRSGHGLRLAKLAESKLADDERAYKWYYTTVSEDIRYLAAFDGLERSSGKTKNAQVVVDLYEKELAQTDDSEFARELKFRIGSLLLEYLDGAKRAQEIFEALLADDAEDIRALGALERILEREGRFTELLEVNNRRMKLAKTPEDMAETLLSGARIHESHLNDKEGAIESYERVAELLPEDPRPLVELHRLYAETGLYEELARVIEKQLALLDVNASFSETRQEAQLNDEGTAALVYGARLVRSEDAAEWVERQSHGLDAEEVIALWSELGDVYREHLSEYEAAIACYDNILLLDINHASSRASLELLLEYGVGVDTICRALSKVYAVETKYQELQATLVRLSEVVSDKRDKISYLVGAAQISRDLLENEEAALECLAKALTCEPASADVKQHLFEMAEAGDSWARVIGILEDVESTMTDASLQELATQYDLELSSLWETQLLDNVKSIEYGRKALKRGAENVEVLEYLQETFIRLESWEDVILVLQAKRVVSEDEAERLNLNMQIAGIRESYLEQNDKAIETLLEVLELHDDHLDAMVSLDRLYAATERWEEAVANYERRLDIVTDEAERDEIECHMAAILSDHLGEVDRALEIYSGVLSRDADKQLAIEGMERMLQASEGTIIEQISEILLPIYDAKDDWEKRTWVDEQILRVALEPDRRRDLLHEIALLQEQRGGDHEKAYEAYARSLKEDLLSQTTLDQLFNYAEVLGKWEELVVVMQDATVDADDVVAAKNIRCIVAEIYREHLNNIDAAILVYVDIHELDPEDLEILDALEGLYREKEAWKELSEVLVNKAHLSTDPDGRKELLFQAASLYEELLEDVDAAIAIHMEVLADDAGERTALDSLERLYLGQENYQELLEIYRAKIEIAEDDDSRKTLYASVGELQVEKLEDKIGAIESYQQICAIDPNDALALEALDRLYLDGSDWTDLLEILERREEVAQDDAERIVFKYRQAECWYRNLDDISRAIEVYRAVFELDAAHAETIVSLEEIIALGGEVAVEAARALVPIYQGLERWEALVKVYEVLVANGDDIDELIQLLGTIGTIQEEILEQPKAALDAWYRALAKDASRQETWDVVERLAASCGYWEELVEKLNNLLVDVSSDGSMAIIVASHLGRIFEEELQQLDKAVEVLRQILDIDASDRNAIRSLDRLYEVQQNWKDLADILHIQIDLAETDEERLAAYYRLGAVQETCLENYEEAINCYNEMLMIVPNQPEAIESLVRIFSGGHSVFAIADILEPYYRGIDAWEALVAFDLQLVEHIEERDTRYDKLLEVADVYLQELQAIEHGLDIYGRALIERPGDDLCLSKIDELSEVLQLWDNNVVYYQKAIEACDDDIIKQDLTLRMAQTYDLRLDDMANAERCYQDVLGFDPEHLVSLEALDRIFLGQERWQELAAIMRRELVLVDSDTERIDLYMRLGAVLFEMLNNGDEAIAAYDEILDIEPGYWNALCALEGIYHSREDWASLYDVYEKQATASNDDMQRVELWGKMAQLASEILERSDDAVDLWYQVIDVLGDNLVALANLEHLFIIAERWADVAEVTERQVPLFADNPEQQLETYRKLGRIYRDKLEDNERSLDYWRHAHEVNAHDLETLRAIEAIDELLEDKDDLAATLRKILQTGQLEFTEQLACAVKLAKTLDELGRVDETIEIWLYVLQLDGTHLQALAELERLYEGQGRWSDVVETLTTKLAVLPELEDKVALYNQIAGIWETQVNDIDRAAAAYQNILEIDAKRDVAFTSLEELLTNHEKWQDLLGAYIERAEVVEQQKLRLEFLLKAAKIAETKLDKPEMSFVVLQSAIQENWKDEHLRAEIARLADLTGNWEELVGQFEALINETNNVSDSFELHNYVARWYFHHLNNNEASWHHFQHVLTQDPNNLAALASMTEIFWRLGNWEDLVNYLQRRIELTTITDERVSLFKELARVFEEKIGDLELAVECYLRAYKLMPERLDVMQELARIYEDTQHWDELIDILEKETTVITDRDERNSVHYKIGGIWEHMLAKPERAAEAYQVVIDSDDSHLEALIALERLDIALERYQHLLKVYDHQLAALQEPSEQIEIYTKISAVYEKHLNDLENAISSMVQVTLIDPNHIEGIKELERLYELAQRWPDLVDMLNTHISILGDVHQHVELYRKLGVVYRDKLEDASQASESFLTLLDIASGDVPALYAMADLSSGFEDYISAIEYLNRVIACLQDPAEVTDVHYRIGSINDTKLEDDVAAEESYKVCLDIDASYMPAIDALKKLYERREDWSSVVRMLKQKAEYTREMDHKAAIFSELGYVSLKKIGDSVNAYAYYEEALSLQPDDVEAALPLAEKNLEDQSWARALVLYEIVIKGLGYHGDSAELYSLNYKAGLCCQNLAQHDKALEFYRASYELNQNHAPTILGMGQELLQFEDYERAYNMFQILLEKFTNDLEPEQIIGIYFDSAIIKKETNELSLARQLLERILEADGSHEASLELIIDICEEMADWEALVYYLNVQVDRETDKSIKFINVMKMAKVFGENLRDGQRQVEAYYKALEIDPDSKVVLNELLNLYHSNGQWENAIGIIERLCTSEPSSEKVSKFYYTIAVIYRDELNNDEKAVEYFNKTLDTNVNELRAFEAIDRILTASRDWPQLERNYRKMIKRVRENDGDHLKDTKHLLWYGLGEIYRTRLEEWDKAVTAFRKATEISPNDERLHNILAELYMRMPDHEAEAIEELRILINNCETTMTREQEVRNYRGLFYLYYKTKQFDKAWCISEITCFKGIAQDDEIQYHDNYVDAGLAIIESRLRPDDSPLFIHPGLSMQLTRLFQSYQQSLRPAFNFREKDLGISKRDRLPYREDQLFWKIYRSMAQVIGVHPEPEVFLSGNIGSGIICANLDYNAFVIAPDMLGGRSQREVGFILARSLIMFQSFYMAGLGLATDTLKMLILVSIAFFTNKGAKDNSAQQIMNALGNMSKFQLNNLQKELGPLIRGESEANVSAWLKGVDLTCNRVGLLLCGDLSVALHCIKIDPRPVSKLTNAERESDLIKFAMSEEYFELRRRLGIAIGE